ncbi:hypothetical protein HNR77_004422 [Paenibacillus sp. JGP012]|nr:hypothetical protein [Paenibacillus sp. JGP012]MBB6023322.1 hypothetical protein [Paenibacillus sp. JGP012]
MKDEMKPENWPAWATESVEVVEANEEKRIRRPNRSLLHRFWMEGYDGRA